MLQLLRLLCGQVLLVERKLADVHAVLGQASNAIEQWAAPSVHQKESLKVFFLVLQVCHYLMCGQVLAFHNCPECATWPVE